MDEQALDELIAAYVLNTLPAPERAEVEALLARSAQARALLRRYQALFGALATLTPYRRAPEGAAERFRARLAAEAARPRRHARIAARLALAAAALLIVAVGILLLSAQQPDPITALLNDPSALRIDLTPQDASVGSARLIARRGSDQCVLVAELPPPPVDQQYQVWLILSESDIRSGGLLTDAQPLTVRLPDPSRPYTFGITLEPRGGSPQPTDAPLFIGELPPLRP